MYLRSIRYYHDLD